MIPTVPIKISLGHSPEQMRPRPPMEIFDMVAGEDVQELQTEAKTEDNVEADGAQIPPTTEFPSNDVESQEAGTKTEAELERKKEVEDLIFSASISSTWIPSVVGDPKQRFFLKAGEAFDLSFLSKSTLSYKNTQVL